MVDAQVLGRSHVDLKDIQTKTLFFKKTHRSHFAHKDSQLDPFHHDEKLKAF